MRTLLFASEAYGAHGGIALYNRDIAQSLAERSDVDEVAVIPRNAPIPVDAIPEKVRFLADIAGSKQRYVRAAFGEIRAGHELVICGHINLLPLAVMVNAFIRAPLALVVYGVDAWQCPYRWAARWLGKVDAVWSISAVTRDRMGSWAGAKNSRKCVILPIAIHMERFGLANRRADLVQRYGLKNAKVILTLARLSTVERYKGVDEVLDLMPSLLEHEPALRYLVAGEGDDRVRLEAKARSMGLASEVTFIGAVREDEKADVYRLADAYVMPGSGEGFGFVYLEALACGVPVVGSLVDGSREALRDGALGELVDSGSPRSVQEGILRALSKPKVIPAGIEYFAWPSFSDRVNQAVDDLLSAR